MLTNLKIQNVAIIENIDIEFKKGFNALTGETGAGKSILFDALGFVLGNRADRTLIRSGQEKAKVVAAFDITHNSNVKNILTQLEIDYDNELIITRVMSVEGKNTILLNSIPTTLAVLKSVSINLVDIYGQNEHQILLDPIKQLELLDNFGKGEIITIKTYYSQKLSQYRALNKELHSLGGSEEERLREIDYLNYQIEELEKAKLSVDEEAELLQKKNILHNAEKISSSVKQSSAALEYVMNYLKTADNELSHASGFDSGLVSLQEQLINAKIELQDVSDSLNKYLTNTQFDEGEFNRVDERLDVYSSIKRKYGKDVAGVIETHLKLKERLELLCNLTTKRNEINNAIKKVSEELESLATKLTEKRKEIAKLLESKLCNELAFLGIKNARITFEFTNLRTFEDRGNCDVEILFSANLGEPLKPLKAIISGGEMSRFMLALKVVAGESDKMPTMIFDEIDTGISGQMSEIMAKKLYEVSLNHQVLTITHSAQIASMCDNHYLIEKHEQMGKTISNIKLLTENERVTEIAKFMAGTTNLIYALQSARALLQEQCVFKKSLIQK